MSQPISCDAKTAAITPQPPLPVIRQPADNRQEPQSNRNVQPDDGPDSDGANQRRLLDVKPADGCLNIGCKSHNPCFDCLMRMRIENGGGGTQQPSSSGGDRSASAGSIAARANIADSDSILPSTTLPVGSRPNPIRNRRKFKRTKEEYKADVCAKLAEVGASMKTEYDGGRTAVVVVCRNKFERPLQPETILRAGFVCKCEKCVVPDLSEDEREFIDYVKKYHPLAQVVGKYLGKNKKIAMICPLKHSCSPKPKSVMEGQGICDECGKAAARRKRENMDRSAGHTGENKLAKLLREVATETVVKEFKISDDEGVEWSFDFKVGNRITELDGDHHFKPFGTSDGIAKLKKQRSNDILKTKLALSKGFDVVRIHYGWLCRQNKLQEQIAFLRAVLASSERLLVSDAIVYGWLKEAGLTITQPTIHSDKAADSKNDDSKSASDDTKNTKTSDDAAGLEMDAMDEDFAAVMQDLRTRKIPRLNATNRPMPEYDGLPPLHASVSSNQQNQTAADTKSSAKNPKQSTSDC
jgi:hypothetical protein